MSGGFRLETERLVLRGWEDQDREPFAALNADAQVMEHFVAPLPRAESDRAIDIFEAELASRGYCPFVVEERATGAFVGFVGLHDVPPEVPFAPGVEVGWRLALRFWGHGYATEAARSALSYGFETLGLDEIVSFTTVANVRSRAVMERLGMTRDPAEDFEHPRVPVGHRVRPHVLYRLSSVSWSARG